MADAKISALTALTGANLDATADVIAVVDTSLTTTKKMTADELNIGLLASTTVARFKVGSFTRDQATASGSQSITGVGFKPKFIKFISGFNSGTFGGSCGASDAVTHSCLQITGDSVYSNTGFCIYIAPLSAVDYQTALVASFDADGFTLTWTKNGSPTGTGAISYEAFR